MNGPVWIEQLNSLHRVVSRTRCEGDTLRVGRGYANDLVLDDPRVAPDHLLIRIAPDGAMTAIGVGEQSFHLDGERAPRKEVRIDGDSVLRIGHTRLRIRAADYPVPEQARTERGTGLAPLALGGLFLLATMLLAALDQWRGNANAAPYWRMLPDTLGLGFIILIWVGGWALVSRLFGHRGRFGVHLLVAAAALCAISLLDAILGPLLYGLSLSVPAYFQGFLQSLLIVVMIYVHIGALGERYQPARRRYLAFALMAVGVTVLVNGQLGQEDKGNIPNITSAYPPGLRLVGTLSLDQTLEALNGMEQDVKATLDEPVPEKLR